MPKMMPCPLMTGLAFLGILGIRLSFPNVQHSASECPKLVRMKVFSRKRSKLENPATISGEQIQVRMPLHQGAVVMQAISMCCCISDVFSMQLVLGTCFMSGKIHPAQRIADGAAVWYTLSSPLQEQPEAVEGLSQPKRHKVGEPQLQAEPQPQQQRPRRRQEAALVGKASRASGRGPSKRLHQRHADREDRQVAAPAHAGEPAAAATQGAAAGSVRVVPTAGRQAPTAVGSQGVHAAAPAAANAAGQQAAGRWVRHRDVNYYACRHLQPGDYWWRGEDESCTGRKLREVRQSPASCCAPWLGLLSCFSGLSHAVCLDSCCRAAVAGPPRSARPPVLHQAVCFDPSCQGVADCSVGHCCTSVCASTFIVKNAESACLLDLSVNVTVPDCSMASCCTRLCASTSLVNGGP